MENDGKIISFTIAAVLAIMFGSLLAGSALKNQCVALVKDKPAIEIQAICK